ncbi:hypothetical protein BJ138DRAFT_1124793 [Hygrophoropsis aurantiaca]|uniref:Uncharacterized protein n=1 Tax=Hygrophoropsis aurantiaca TaxID=72124 RepID=A0ACB8AHY1_9AGAM|nr:hypothetical protein BJ138DRAFT_1124793 [Hygrophoropsis aurantiaca]
MHQVNVATSSTLERITACLVAMSSSSAVRPTTGNALRSIMGKIGHEALMINYYKNELEGSGEALEGEDAGSDRDPERAPRNQNHARQFHIEDAPSRTSFKYPRGGLLQLRDVLKEDELRHPIMLDANGEECLIVVKNGNTTGITIGRTTGIESFVREYDDYAIRSTRIVGILTSGTGQTDSTDVTYASPYYWLEERIKTAFSDSYLYPITA